MLLDMGDPTGPRAQGVCSALPLPPSPVGKNLLCSEFMVSEPVLPRVPRPSKRGPRTCPSGLPPEARDPHGPCRRAPWSKMAEVGVTAWCHVVSIVTQAWPCTLMALGSALGCAVGGSL